LKKNKKEKRVEIRLSHEEYDKIKTLADSRGEKMSKILREMIDSAYHGLITSQGMQLAKEQKGSSYQVQTLQSIKLNHNEKQLEISINLDVENLKPYSVWVGKEVANHFIQIGQAEVEYRHQHQRLLEEGWSE